MDFIYNVIHWSGAENIFTIGSFGIRYYSMCWLLAFVVSYILMLQVFKKEGKTQDDLDKLTIYIFLGTILGARIGHCLFYEFDYYSQNPLEILLPFSKRSGSWEFTGFAGLASHGGAIGILTALYLYAKKTKTNFVWIADRLVLVVPIAGAFIRIGNFFNSEIIGKAADASLPWAVVFTQIDTVPRHPGQLYEAVGYIILFFILWAIYKKNQNPKQGLLFGIFLVCLFSIRFFVEFFKENQEAFEDSMFINMGQLLSIPFILAGLYLIFRPATTVKSKK
ncbi:MAG TPA: prolipoprotein diacylglyceryl transferase [Sphingobacterium bovisgrunnientis]|jgi:phosphatidylglycerol:prolipoprotein diacylglycerol transferase|uniref:prolipoprotein diacylglyceryl transferase n=1 Tax=Sphingobacterium bovisgrunnientis TaxID=1874697 RepID=UPI001358ECDB|nr:prolipoprotein diacylglyceryl transferase [Sphingobacterium bovisgrunnientis]HLS38388.1 prolipoprotein diacylglyceryl transferase [Sphingobacterium bovisgrunnientis]